MKNYFKSLSEEQPDVRFFGLRLVKFVSVIFGSVFFFTLAVTLLDTSALDWKLNLEGLKFFFLDAMKVPGSILAFYLAVLGLIGANHRSEQTKKQIEEASVQNDFANYYKHKEEFLSYVNDIPESQFFVISKMTRMHGKLFPGSRARDFQVNEECVLTLDSYIGLFAKYLSELVDESSYQSALENLEGLHNSIRNYFGLKSNYIGKIMGPVREQQGFGGVPDLKLNVYLNQFLNMFEHVDILFQFTPDYRPSGKMSYLIRCKGYWPSVDELKFDSLETTKAETYKKIAKEILKS